MFPKSNDKSETQSSQAALNDAWRKVTERCKFSLAGGVSELSGLIWYMIAITISVHISRAGGPTQGRRQPQRRWKKVHLASVITDVFVYLHSFLRRPANGRDYILTCFSLQLAQNLESAPTYPALGLQWRPWLRPTTSTALWQSLFSVSLPSPKFICFLLSAHLTHRRCRSCAYWNRAL